MCWTTKLSHQLIIDRWICQAKGHGSCHWVQPPRCQRSSEDLQQCIAPHVEQSWPIGRDIRKIMLQYWNDGNSLFLQNAIHGQERRWELASSILSEILHLSKRTWLENGAWRWWYQWYQWYPIWFYLQMLVFQPCLPHDKPAPDQVVTSNWAMCPGAEGGGVLRSEETWELFGTRESREFTANGTANHLDFEKKV